MTDERPQSGGQTRESADERSYSIAFHDVWEAAVAAAGTLREWSVTASDPRSGTLAITTADRFGRRPLPGSVRLWLDELGQTRMEVRLSEPVRLLASGSAARRIARFLTRVDAALRAGAPR